MTRGLQHKSKTTVLYPESDPDENVSEGDDKQHLAEPAAKDRKSVV